MTRYAENTTVAPEKSRGEIERVLTRYGASAFGYAWMDSDDRRAATAVITFIAHDKHVQFRLPLPSRTDDDIVYTHRTQPRYAWRRRSSAQIETAYDQAVRQRWRALALCIKAKLEAVAAGIVDFENEFLAHVVLPSGQTVGDWLVPQLDDVYAQGLMPGGLTLALPAPDDTIDVESA